MWIKFKKTYCGPEGVFAKGLRTDLPAEKLDRIKSRFYENTCPPWEDHLDRAAIDQAAAREAISKANLHLSALRANAGKAAENHLRLEKAYKNTAAREQVIVGDIEKAEKLAAKKAGQLEKTKKPKSRKDKEKFAALERQAADCLIDLTALEAEQRRLPALVLKAQGQLMIAEADSELIEIDLTAAQIDIDRLKEKLGIEPEPQTGARSASAGIKDEDDSKEPTAETESQSDDALTEGQTGKTEPKTD